MSRKGVERKGDEWHVCRMENSTMRVWVGKYKTEEEALIAHHIAEQHREERDAWIAKHRESLKERIDVAIEGWYGKNNKNNT